MNIDVAFAPCRAQCIRLEQTGQADWPASWMISEVSASATSLWAGAEASHFTGDAHDNTWEHLLENHEDDIKNVDILFAPHHGRDSGMDCQ